MSSEELLQENARLRERVAALEAAQRRSGAGSWELGADGRFEWSDSMYDLVGHQPLNEIPSPDLFARSIHPDDQARVREALESNWGGTTTRNFDYRLRMADGSLRHLRTNAELRHRTDGVPYVAGTTHDVTDLHEALAELRVRNLSIESALTPGMSSSMTNSSPSRHASIAMAAGRAAVPRSCWVSRSRSRNGSVRINMVHCLLT